MIKINLLPTKNVRKRSMGLMQLVALLVAYVVLIAVLAFLYYDKQGQIDKFNKEIAAIEKDIVKQKQYQKDLDEYKKRESALQQKLDVIKNLRQSKTTPTVYMEELSKIIPQKVWLEEFNNANGNILMKGLATEHQDVALFMSNLESSKMFANIKMDAITRKEVKIPGMANSQVLEFTITCNLVTEEKKG